MNPVSPLVAFHGDPAIKAKYVARMRAHIDADELIQGEGWDGHRGCAIGCTLDRYERSAYPEEIGYPIPLAELEDSLFEGLPATAARPFALHFLESAREGSDLTRVHHRFLAWILTDGHVFPVNAPSAEVCGRVAGLHSRSAEGEDVPGVEWDAAGDAARDAARAAARAAGSVARAAAWDAVRAAGWAASHAAETAGWAAAALAAETAGWAAGAAGWAARDAAEAAGAAAWDAAGAAGWAAGSAGWAAGWAVTGVAAWAARDAAGAAAWDAMAAKLLALLAEAPIRRIDGETGGAP